MNTEFQNALLHYFERKGKVDDVERIVNVAHGLGIKPFGYTTATCVWAWHSKKQCLPWAVLPPDDAELQKVIEAFVEEFRE